MGCLHKHLSLKMQLYLKQFYTIQRVILKKLYNLHPPNENFVCLKNKNFLTKIYRNI